MRSPNDVSSVLFPALCSDLGFPGLSDEDRFDPLRFGIPPESGLEQFRRLSAIACAFKKSEVEVSATAELDSFNDFLAANEACRKKSVEEFRTLDYPIAVGIAINSARMYLWDWFAQQNEPDSPITMATIETAARFGPGRSVGLGEKPSLFYFKVGDSRQTASSDFVRSWYESSVLHNPLCEAAEMARKARWGRAEVTEHGLLSFVPKKYSRKRIVVTEPSLNTYFQLGVASRMEEVLQNRVGIDFTSEPAHNQELARRGSVYGAYATMDLTQCSDYISLALVEYMFPPSVVRWMKILRTPSVLVDKTPIDLAMTSTMGNGFTFPMQTALLAALVRGVYRTLDLPHKEQVTDKEGNPTVERTWGVFGDDIVVVPEAFDLLVETLEYLGLKVNQSKSFSSGPFRESCGADFYDGINVRPVYLKRYSSDQDLFSCFNRLAIWAAKSDLQLPRTLGLILKLLEAGYPVVPPDEGVTAGIISPIPPSRQIGGLWLYSAYRPRMSSIRFEPWAELTIDIPEGKKRRSKHFKKWLSELLRVCSGSVNEPALLKTLLYGGLRKAKMSPRMESVTYSLKSLATPRWGWSDLDGMPKPGTPEFHRWQEIVSRAILL